MKAGEGKKKREILGGPAEGGGGVRGRAVRWRGGPGQGVRRRGLRALWPSGPPIFSRPDPRPWVSQLFTGAGAMYSTTGGAAYPAGASAMYYACGIRVSCTTVSHLNKAIEETSLVHFAGLVDVDGLLLGKYDDGVLCGIRPRTVAGSAPCVKLARIHLLSLFPVKGARRKSNMPFPHPISKTLPASRLASRRRR